MFHNIRSARGPGLELLEAEMGRWGVGWDVVGLAETWLDEESEMRVTVDGYGAVCGRVCSAHWKIGHAYPSVPSVWSL